jgi:hypothetical protein
MEMVTQEDLVAELELEYLAVLVEDLEIKEDILHQKDSLEEMLGLLTKKQELEVVEPLIRVEAQALETVVLEEMELQVVLQEHL